MKRLRRIIRISVKALLILIVVCVVLCAGFIIYSTVRKFNPAPVTELSVEKSSQPAVIAQSEFSLLTWNIGYCGLGMEMDYFYYGGRLVRPSEILYQQYLNGVFNFLAKCDTMDFILLQEVDVDSRRSYYSNQAEVFRDDLPMHTRTFACNYKTDFIPVPVINPVGKVESGLMTFSEFIPVSARRFSFPVKYSWPKNLFMPERCFVAERFPLPAGMELILINLHNSPLEDAAVMRMYELWMLRSFMLAEYEKGNYVIAGGDWNQNPPEYNDKSFKEKYKKNPKYSLIDSDFMPKDWTWAYDPQYPTNREIYEEYSPGSTLTQTIDFFLASPNIIVDAVNVIPTDFEFSDHHPVYLKMHLIENTRQLAPARFSSTLKTLQDSIRFLNEKLSRFRAESSGSEKKPDRFYLRK